MLKCDVSQCKHLLADVHKSLFAELLHQFTKDKSSHKRCSVGEGVLRNFTKLTGKHLCQSLFFNRKETLAEVFYCEFCEISKNTFFTEHLWATASVFAG